MLKQVLLIISSVFVFLLTSCQSETKLVPPKPKLISANQLVFYDNATLRRVIASHDSLVYQPADYQLSINRISYRTTLPDGSEIVASGIVYLPVQGSATAKMYPLLSFQHPTAYTNAEAPSGVDFGTVRFSYPIYFATHGYIVTCPDYIGYGTTDSVPHDYEHRQTLAQATTDMLLATQEFLTRKAFSWNNQVFLAGYSEGGYASLSAQKFIEEQSPGNLHITASSCGAGPYAMSAFFDYLTRHPTTGGVANYLYTWETLSYNRIYGLNKPVSYYFKSPYAEQISQSLEQTRNMHLSFDQICTNQFRADMGDPDSPFRKALADNDLTNWTTNTPTQLIHSEEDEIIPFLTSQQTYDSMRQRGASKLSLITLKKGAHVPTEVLFMRRTLDWFERLKS